MSGQDDTDFDDPGPEPDAPLTRGEPQGGIVIGEFGGGAVAAGPEATAEDSSRRLGVSSTEIPPPSVAAPPPGGIAIGRMTGGAAASGPGARATNRSEHFIEATPQLIEALALLSVHDGELGTEAVDIEREVRTNGGVEQGRLRRLAALAGRATATVGGQTAAGVAAQTIIGMLA
ncbi:hypothetical protein [Streptomyces sp. NPDC002490]|uniref:hypothetical protein n=1 Tax=Streptomyces sp. NPDC002490 TaxID=3154416 RepID=UPI00331A432A